MGADLHTVSWPTRQLPLPGANVKWKANEERINQSIARLKADGGEKKNKDAIKKLESERQPEPFMRALWDRGEPSPQYVLTRGNYLRPGALVQAGIPAIIANGGCYYNLPSSPSSRAAYV